MLSACDNELAQQHRFISQGASWRASGFAHSGPGTKLFPPISSLKLIAEHEKAVALAGDFAGRGWRGWH